MRSMGRLPSWPGFAALVLCGIVADSGAPAQGQRPAPARQAVPAPFAFPAGGITGSSATFIRVSLPRNVEIAVPRAWRVLGPDELQLIATAAGAALDLSGENVEAGTDRVLIAANSVPARTYAAVRVTSSTPPSMSASDLRDLSRLMGQSSATSSELAKIASATHAEMDSMLRKGGMSITQFYGVRVDRVGGQTALVTEYKRTGLRGDVFVQLNQILTPVQDIQLNLSYRESEKGIWFPVLGRIRHSLSVK